MHYLNGWHPLESIRFDLVKITYGDAYSSSDLGVTKTASTKTKINSMIVRLYQKPSLILIVKIYKYI